MRLRFAGKLAAFALGLAGLYGLWRATSTVRHRLPRARPVAAILPRAVPSAHDGFVIGYAGCPPPAALDLSQPGVVPNPALADGLGQPVRLERVSWADANQDPVSGLASGSLDAAVVDYPSVVRAAMDGEAPPPVVLLVSWRAGSDAVRTEDGKPAPADQAVDTTRSGSADYLMAVVYGSARYSPEEKSKALRTIRDGAARSPNGAAKAIAGRVDQMPARARQWPTWQSTAKLPAAMPDVLVVSAALARRSPETVTRLVRAWLKGQEAISGNTSDWKRYVAEQAKATGINAEDLSRQLAPASVTDQMAFAGLAGGMAGYARLAAKQARAVTSGPLPDFSAPMDAGPLRDAIAEH
ncbi:MAG TPA: hypothetical protein VGM37_04040 [Armatimonadota bacterium]|jgi:hypothetical protein